MKKEVAFLRGFAKSGTNWACNLLNLHPEIDCNGEFHFEHLFRGFRDTLDARWGLMTRNHQIFREEYFSFINKLVIRSAKKKDATVFIDRTPQDISMCFIPQRKYIYIARDGRDVAVSWIYHCLRLEIFTSPFVKSHHKTFKIDKDYFENNKNQLLNNEEYLTGIANSWNSHVIRNYKFYEKTKSGEIKASCFWLKYEDLHKDVDLYRNQLYEYFGLDPLLAEGLTVKTKPGFERTDNTSFYRKGKAGAWREYFTEEQHSWFIQKAKPALELLGHDLIY